MKSKDRYLGVLNMPDATEVSFSPELQKYFSMVKVDVAKRLKLNKRRKRLPIIYHKITANKTYSTINLQMRVTELEIFTIGVFFELSPQVDNPLNRLVVMAKYGSMMLAGDCDFIQVQQSLRKDLSTKCSKNNKIFQSLNCDFIQVQQCNV